MPSDRRGETSQGKESLLEKMQKEVRDRAPQPSRGPLSTTQHPVRPDTGSSRGGLWEHDRTIQKYLDQRGGSSRYNGELERGTRLPEKAGGDPSGSKDGTPGDKSKLSPA